ncbi:MAG: rhodanese-like domain-containing protein, partial [Alphaproteobacteria bacterium]|nr:rhodanese-like domain-containing protein [Alphaproteobacteria bacterium]
MARVGPDELSGLRSAVIVDLREADERDTIGWVPGSVWRPVGADPETWARALPAGRPLVLVCMTGRRSLALIDTVARVTGGPVVDLEGGTIGWAETGLPLVRMDAATLPGELAGDLRAVSMQEFQ